MEAGQHVTAKVILHSKEGADPVRLSFLPDYAQGCNAEWASATPSLNLSMTVRADVAELFEVSEAITLTFSRTAEDEPEQGDSQE